MLRSLDFHSPADRTSALTSLLKIAETKNAEEASRRDHLMIEAMLKLPEQNLAEQPEMTAVVNRVLQNTKDRGEQLRILRQLKSKDANARLVALGLSGEIDSTSVQAFEALVAKGAAADLEPQLLSDQPATATRAAEVLALCNGTRCNEGHDGGTREWKSDS